MPCTAHALNCFTHRSLIRACLQVFLDGQAALEEEERKEEKAGKEFRRFNRRSEQRQF